MDRPASIAQEGPTVKVQSESALLCTLYTLWKCAWHIKEKSPCSQVSFAPATDSYRYINANSLMIATKGSPSSRSAHSPVLSVRL